MKEKAELGRWALKRQVKNKRLVSITACNLPAIDLSTIADFLCFVLPCVSV